jgi:glyceraldehyde 3-phosphate dehydrogenase
MKIRVAINGFGRIGRTAFKIAHARSDIEVVAINDLSDTKTLAHLLKHDSNYPAYEWAKSVEATSNGLIVDGKGVYVFSETDPRKLPWKQLNVDVVIESTGIFTSKQGASGHLDAGAKRVVISAPISGEGETVVLGVNDDTIGDISGVVSNASCTTNCVAPLLNILTDTVGVKKSIMTTIHSYTASQRLQDAPHKSLREARAAAENIVPSTTGASKAVASVLPSTTGKFSGLSVRVPTPVVSLVDLVFVASKKTTKDEINKIFIDAAKDPFYQGIVGVSEEELVSSDYIGNSYSATVDLSLTDVVDGDLVKVVAWYDNEWGYSNRLVELTTDVGRYAWEDARRNSKKVESSSNNSYVAPAAEPKVSEPKTEMASSQTPAQTENQQQAQCKKRKRGGKGNQAGDSQNNPNQSLNNSQNNNNNVQQKDAAPAAQPVITNQPVAPVSTPTPAPAAPQLQTAAPQAEPQLDEDNVVDDNDVQERLAQKLIQIEGDDHIN